MATTENRSYETVKNIFTEDERRRLGENLARTVQELVDNKAARSEEHTSELQSPC